jgi:hypothetical protein
MDVIYPTVIDCLAPQYWLYEDYLNWLSLEIAEKLSPATKYNFEYIMNRFPLIKYIYLNCYRGADNVGENEHRWNYHLTNGDLVIDRSLNVPLNRRLIECNRIEMFRILSGAARELAHL